MSFTIKLSEISSQDAQKVGGKALSLALLLNQGINVPRGLCVTTEAFKTYIESTGIVGSIALELERKSLDELRWEEMWDISLRIRNLFINTDFPFALKERLGKELSSSLPNLSMVVRSSAPEEDSASKSFAGLHDSYVNITGIENILRNIRLVWASLFSDGAILYRKELGLDIHKSTMAVVIQELVQGERSGVIFTVNPFNDQEMLLEAVYGLNQGLVDGTIQPDRWNIDRNTKKILNFLLTKHDRFTITKQSGVETRAIDSTLHDKAPLDDIDIDMIFTVAEKIENFFKHPQDIEWTIAGDTLYILQSRPITTTSSSKSNDQRSWYLQLKKSFAKLQEIRSIIVQDILPGMDLDAQSFSSIDLASLDNDSLLSEREKRTHRYSYWEDKYRSYCIPFAHGMRLFGQIYNDILKPGDPYEFMDLLLGSDLISLKRNAILVKLAKLAKSMGITKTSLQDYLQSNNEFKRNLDTYITKYGFVSCIDTDCLDESLSLAELVLEMTSSPNINSPQKREVTEQLLSNYFSHFTEDDQAFARDLLEMGRASYAMRDNDNIYLGRLKHLVLSADAELLKRSKTNVNLRETLSIGKVDSLIDPIDSNKNEDTYRERRLIPRQIVGQRAGPGFAKGNAHIIRSASDLFNFRKGEILICDAIEPNMTFVVPLASGIVERRGGMLIHGAIIAREYGIPCVTGIPNATNIIKNGELVSVDGYLGIVTIG